MSETVDDATFFVVAFFAFALVLVLVSVFLRLSKYLSTSAIEDPTSTASTKGLLIISKSFLSVFFFSAFTTAGEALTVFAPDPK